MGTLKKDTALMPPVWRNLLQATTMSSIVIVIVLVTISLTFGASSDEWRDEFEEICSLVQVGDTLSLEELRSLISRIDILIPMIQSSQEPSKKVYIFRIKKCRSFFEYCIALKQAENSAQ